MTEEVFLGIVYKRSTKLFCVNASEELLHAKCPDSPLYKAAMGQMVGVTQSQELLWAEWLGWPNLRSCYGPNGWGDPISGAAMGRMVGVALSEELLWAEWLGRPNLRSCYGPNGWGGPI